MKIPLPMSGRAVSALTARMRPEASFVRPPVSERAFYQPATGNINLPENYLLSGRDIDFMRDRTGLPLPLAGDPNEPYRSVPSPALADLMAGHERRHGQVYENPGFRFDDPDYQRNAAAIKALRDEPGIWPDPETDPMASAKAKIMSTDEFDADVYGNAYERALGQHENRPLLPHEEMMKLALIEALLTRRQIARTEYELPYVAPKNVLSFNQRRLPFEE
jgi:hypothetical protein